MKKSDSIVHYIAGQMDSAGSISYKAMFGGYTFYCDGKIVALVCNDELYVKPTASGRTIIGTVHEAPPYPGAKPYFAVQDMIDDKELIGRLIRATAAEMPLPKPKKVKNKVSVRSERK